MWEWPAAEPLKPGIVPKNLEDEDEVPEDVSPLAESKIVSGLSRGGGGSFRASCIGKIYLLEHLKRPT